MKRLIKKIIDAEGAVELLTISVLIVIMALIFRAVTVKCEPDIVSNTPLAGITYYMARLEYHSMALASPDTATIEIIEPKVQTVAEAEISPETCLVAYFGYVLDQWELDEFYQIVMDECGYEPEDGIGAVADVIANRCRSDRFPDTIHEVIYQTNQFEPIVAGTFGRFEVTDLVYEICDDHISEGAAYDDIYYFTAGNYNPYCQPAFVIGNHYFGR